MDTYFKTLQTIYTITQQDPQPESYKCRPREIILRQFQDWSIIQQHLAILEKDELIVTSQEDTLVIKITKKGMEIASGQNKNFIEK